MNRILFIAASLLTLSVQAGAAQPAQPYAGMETRPIKALSEQDMTDLRTGRGMGLALAAELNGYPGPRHVLDLADRLGLSSEQRQAVQGLFNRMTAEAVPLGARLIEAEADLDRQFAQRTISQHGLNGAIDSIGQVQAELRKTHLKYHLLTAGLLTPEQMQAYSRLRGYADMHPKQMHKH